MKNLTFNKIVTFLKALVWHIWLGFPKSSQNEINRRLDICKSCDMFDKKNSQCLVCGCNINNKKIFMNKLAWADQHCPIDKW
jgi:uncharacterized paraquat-inducible protein A